MTPRVRSVALRALLVVAAALLVAAAAYAFSTSQPRQYNSSTLLAYGRQLSPEFQILGPGFGEPDIDEEVLVETRAAEADAYEVAEATARAAPELGYDTGAVAARISARPRRGTLIVVLTAQAASREAAQRLASVYTDQYLRLVRKREEMRATTIAGALEQRLRGLSEGDRAGVIGANLRNQIGAVEVLRRVGSGTPQVIEAARPPSAPAQPQTRRNVLFGLLFGLAVGIGLVALRSESRSGASIAADLRARLGGDEPDDTRRTGR